MQEQELFQSYEVKNWDFSPRIYKILAFSAILNIVVLVGIAQTNLLTTKGCDSPLVGGVCQVIDTLVVGSSIMSTDTKMVNDDYTKTELENSEIIWVDRTGEERFQYPAGYRALANPELMNTPTEIPNADGSFPTNIPGIPNPTTGGGTNDLLNKQQELPQNNPNAVTGKLPDSPFTFDNPTVTTPYNKYRPRTVKTPKGNNPTLNNESPKNLDLGDKTANTNTNTNTNPTTDNSEKVAEVEINKKVMKDFASTVKTKYDKKEVDLSQNFKVVAEGFLTKDGKLDTTPDKKTKQPRSRILTAEGNQQMVEVAAQAIAAIGDSGWLGYLRNQGVEKINFTVVQDNDNLQVIITSDFPTPERANTVTSGLNGLMQGALLADKNGWKKLGDDEKVLLGSAKAVVNPDNGKQFVLNFVLPKPIAQEMITRKLNEPVKPEPQSTAQMKDGNQKTAE